MIEYIYISIDSSGTEHSLVACYTAIEGGYVYFCDGDGQMIHTLFQPISSLRLGVYNEDA